MEYLKEQQSARKQKTPAKIKKVSSEAAARNAEYHRVLDEIDQERNPWCESCGEKSFEHSHLLPRAYNNYAYMNVPANIRRNCRTCHINYENGNLHLITLGEYYLEIVHSLDEQYFRQKMAQFEKRLEEYKKKNWLAISNGTIKIPKWVDEVFKTFQNEQ